MINYNDPEDSQRREKAKNITFEEEKSAVALISEAISIMVNKYGLTESSEDKVQKFIDNYQNLSYHAATSTGLYATDHPETIEKIKGTEFADKFWNVTF